MKRIIPILLLATLALTSCIKDDMESCSATMHLYFSYIYGGTNRFFETVTTPTHLTFYNKAEQQYREVELAVGEVGLMTPYRFLKTSADNGDIEITAWTQDDALDYVDTPSTPLGEGYVKLKELTPGSGICRPVDDLLYGRMAFDAGDRFTRNVLTLPFVRAVCRTRITMIPQTVENGGGVEDDKTRALPTIIPRPEDFKFDLLGTRSGVNYNNTVTNSDEVILQPDCFYDENTSNIATHWFGSFSSEGKFLGVKVYIKDQQVANFDCEPIGLTSIPGNYVDLVIDGRYVKPVMQVRVNGWKVAEVHSNL